VHLGRLKVAIRDRLGVPGAIDERFGDPHRLALIVRQFAGVRFIVPHFGCGTLLDLLPAIHGTRNLYLDTSSSNAWMKDDAHFPDLQTVFRAVLENEDLGPQRLLFGSDSTVFPRGWRADVLQEQKAALQGIGAPAADVEAILGGNLRSLLP
jgi:predicted TIM-barrel fold metal-dependent hydrolase